MTWNPAGVRVLQKTRVSLVRPVLAFNLQIHQMIYCVVCQVYVTYSTNIRALTHAVTGIP